MCRQAPSLPHMTTPPQIWPRVIWHAASALPLLGAAAFSGFTTSGRVAAALGAGLLGGGLRPGTWMSCAAGLLWAAGGMPRLLLLLRGGAGLNVALLGGGVRGLLCDGLLCELPACVAVADGG